MARKLIAFFTPAPTKHVRRKISAERRVKPAQTLERGPPLAPVEIIYHYPKEGHFPQTIREDEHAFK